MALAAGHYLAGGNIGLVYMQNSGMGNAVNPLVSLADPMVYGIPALLLIGWRGEPGIKDEPQHRKQGLITLPLLECLGINYALLPFSNEEAEETLAAAAGLMHSAGEPFALVAGKDTFARYRRAEQSAAGYPLSREEAVSEILPWLEPSDAIVSTTGKLSREIYEYREKTKAGHRQEFLNVGSMGHASQIALGIALNKPQRTVYCLDGDGAVIMHLGALAIAGNSGAGNFRHLVFNNSAHDSVGGQATVGFDIDFLAIAKACGYKKVLRADTRKELAEGLKELKVSAGPSLLEVRIRSGARSDLGRPQTTPVDNKNEFMKFLS